MLTTGNNILKGVQIVGLLLLFAFSACSQTNSKNKQTMKYNQLTKKEEWVILHKGTERPFTGDLLDVTEKGTYVCKQCDASLYKSEDKFDGHCGWPSFDDEIENAVKRVPDADGMRTEIICANCGGHLGHVFEGEGFTSKNTRHCVNSISMKFIPAESAKNSSTEVAYFASGCFWGTEYHFMKAAGVRATTVGYMGGHVQNPSYREVCTGTTGHVETTEILYDTTKTNFEEMIKLYYETHDFTQIGGQGPDIGPQYQSVIFYVNDEQKAIAEKYVKILTDKGFKVATQLRPAKDHEFWDAEDYHQQYYENKNGTPYCHIYRKIF